MLAPQVLSLPRTPVDVDEGLAELKRITDLQRRTCAWNGRDHAMAQLLEARLKPARDEAAPDGTIDAARRQQLVSAFAQEYELVGLATLAYLCGPILDFAEQYLDGDALLWSPDLTETFLLEWMPWVAGDYFDILHSIPNLLDLWVRWALKERGLARPLVLAVILAIDRTRDMFRSACEYELLQLGYEPGEFPLEWQEPAA